MRQLAAMYSSSSSSSRVNVSQLSPLLQPVTSRAAASEGSSSSSSSDDAGVGLLLLGHSMGGVIARAAAAAAWSDPQLGEATAAVACVLSHKAALYGHKAAPYVLQHWAHHPLDAALASSCAAVMCV
jgi:alpha-beta hydrolase superfamily lysophospholipase